MRDDEWRRVVYIVAMPEGRKADIRHQTTDLRLLISDI